MKIRILILALFITSLSWGQSVYTEDFGSSTTVALPYVFGTNATGSATKDANFTSPSWTQSNASANFAGVAGGCMSATIAANGGSNVITCTFNVAAGYALNPTSISYQYRITASGATKLDASISGTTGATANIAQVTTTRSGAFVSLVTSNFTTTTALTGTITLVLNFSGTTATGSTIRLDNCSINGTVTSTGCSPPADPVGTINVASTGCGSTTLSYSGADAATCYWETTSGGSSTALPVTSNYTVSSSAIYYVKNIVATCASTGSASYSATVVGAPSITTQPTSASISSGSNTSFTVTATNIASYQWQFSTDGGTTYNDLSNIGVFTGATTATLTVTGAPTSLNNYKFRCVLTGNSPCTTVTSSVATLTITSAYCMSEGFSGGTSAPSGWTFTGITATYTTAGNYGAASPAISMDTTGDIVLTGTVSNAQQLSFWLKGQGTAGSASNLLVEGWNGSAWVTIDNITAIASSAVATKIYNSGTTPALPANITQFRFTYTKVTGNIGLDDVNVTCVPLCTSAVLSSVKPMFGPVGTQVTVVASSGNLSGATATFGGVAATVVSSSATTLVLTIPAGAVSGDLVITDTQPCTASYYYPILTQDTSSCDISANGFTDLIISEVYDSFANNVWHMELYNPTASPITLTGVYAIDRYATIGDALPTRSVALTGTVAAGAVYLASLGDSGVPCTPGAGFDFFSAASGINDNDEIKLTKSGVVVDDVQAPNDIGYSILRKVTAIGPTATYNAADWNTYTTESCADLGQFLVNSKLPPNVTTQPTASISCSTIGTTITVAGTEGVAGGLGLAYQWYVSAAGATSWTALTNTGVYTGATTATLGISSIFGLNNYQYYCQIRENSATCYKASNAVIIQDIYSTTWNGSAWSNSAPTITKLAFINGNYDTSVNGSFEACSVAVNAGFTLGIKAGDYVSINNDLTVNATANLTVENNGSLVMISDSGVVTNNGTTQIKRTTSPYEKYDYTYWSSPVDSPSILSTFTGWRTDYSYEFLTANFSDTLTINSAGTVTAASPDSFDDYAPWAWHAYTSTMTNGKGYAIMGPTSVAFTPSATATVTFSGKVNNGVIPVSVVESANVANTSDDYNLIGNPYPSAIFADKFITDNGAKISGTLYFWTHVANISTSNPGPDVYNFISDDYALYNLSGGTRASLTGSSTPSSYIGSGQGFFVEAQGNNTLNFNNSMRSKTYANTSFYKTSSVSSQKDRIWLNLQNADGMFGQQLIAYFDEATLGFDWGYDGKVNQSNNYVSFYSLAGGEKYKIQARPTFDNSDIVPLGYFSAVTGEFTISIDQKQGVLNSSTTSVYLEDLDMNIIHDLNQSPYTFTTSYGRYENRFLLRYTNQSLGNQDFTAIDNSVVVSGDHGTLTIKSYLETMKDLVVYDVLGRSLFDAKNINNNDFTASNITESRQALIVKITLTDGTVLTRKIVL